MIYNSVKLIMGVLNNAVAEAYGFDLVDYVTDEEKPIKSKKMLKRKQIGTQKK